MVLHDILIHVNVKNVVTAATSIVTVASAFCAITPTPDKTTTWGKIYNLIEVLALTIGKAKDQGVTTTVTTSSSGVQVTPVTTTSNSGQK